MAPSYALASRKGAAKRWQGYVQAGLLSHEMISSGVPTFLVIRKATSPEALCASRWRTPRGRRTMACAETPCARTGRSRAFSSG